MHKVMKISGGEMMKALKIVLRSIISIALIFILSVANYSWAQETLPKNEDAIIESFKGTKAEFLQTNMSCNGKIVDKFLDMESMLQIAEYVIMDLEIVGSRQEQEALPVAAEVFESRDLLDKETYYLVKNDSTENKQIIVWGKDKEGRAITIILTAEMDLYSDFQQTSIFVDIIESEEVSTIKTTKDKVIELFKTFNIEAEISTCIIGTFEGQLSSKDRVRKITTAIGMINGSKVEGLSDSSVTSVSVYTPNIENFIFTGNNKMNLNISMRYNEYEGKTYIWMGTPIITIGY